MHRDTRTGDCGGACPPVCLQHVTIDLDRELAEPEVVEHGAYAAPNQTLDFLGAPSDLLTLTRRTRLGRAR